MSEIDDERLSPEDERLSPGAERAREALSAAVRDETAPRAGAALRARLREEFASGRIAERDRVGAGAAESAGVAERAPRAERGALPLRRPWFALPAWRAAGLAAAAAIVILVGGLLNQGAAWRVMPDGAGAGAGAAEPGVVEIDGLPTPTTDLAALAERLKPGAEIRMAAGGPLRLVSGDALALELPPGAEMTLPPPPPRWVERQSEIWSRAGEIRITTGPGFRGARLSVNTAEAVVELTGTTVAVIRDQSGTCVCVLDGAVRMGLAPGPDGATDPNTVAPTMATIPAGVRCLMYKDARPPLLEPISEMERTKLAMFRDMGLGAMGSRATR